MKTGIRKLPAVCMIFAIVCLNALTVFAEERTLPGGIAESELAAEIDAYVENHIDTTAGMAYAVFDKEGDIASGFYGYADKENQIPVDDDTVFEWGSCSKILIWVSVMQLYEQGKLDLNADIRNYIPQGFLRNLNYDTPVTMIDLMNHTAGFQENIPNLMTKTRIYENLKEALSDYQPEQVYEPGTTVAYSNFGAALAAFVVEQLSGMDYVDYIHANIFEPLHMDHSAIADDLSDNEWVAEQRKKLMCYDTEGNSLGNAFYYIPVYPAGSCTSALADFKTFAENLMDENTILFREEGTWKEMFEPTRLYTGTEISRNCHGMWVRLLGVPVVGHGGNTMGCSSYLLMDVENGIGTVVMTNQECETVYNRDMMDLIYGEFEAAEYGIETEDPGGLYESARTVKTGPLKLYSLFCRGTASDITGSSFFSFAEDGGRSRLECMASDAPEVNIAGHVLEIGMTGVCLELLLAGIVITVIRAVRRISGKKKGQPMKKVQRSICLLAGSEALFAAMLTYAVLSVLNNQTASAYQWTFGAMGILAALACVLFGCGLYTTVKLQDRTRGYKACNYIILAGGLMMVINVIYWNLYMFWAL